MDSSQKELVRRHYTSLVSGIDEVDTILDYLYSEKILSDNIRQRILREKDPKQRNRMLLDHLQKRPPSDFPKFARVLCMTDQGHLAELLIPGISAQAGTEVPHNISSPADSDVHSVDHRSMNPASKPTCRVSEGGEATSVLALGEDYIDDDPKPPYSLPEVWPAEEILSMPVSVRPVTKKEMKSKWNENKRQKEHPNQNDSMYTMCGRGRAIIISNQAFHDSKYDRHGNKFDEERIKTLLETLNFDVEVWPNKTKDELFGGTGLLSNEARMGRDDYQCFLMVILSHGQRDKIMTADNDYVPVVEIVDYFDAKRSHRFARKPKIFLVQACQGDDKDNGSVPKRLADVTERFNGMNLETTDAGTVPRDADKLPSFSDIIVVNATAPGFVSWRNTLYGTWFIQAVIEVFSNLACEDDLMTMLTKVNNLVSRGLTKDGKHIQISNINLYTLRKAVYFFPGLKS